jgi:23S rRNA pseudouridine1911/1915/1917 synthase
VSDQFFNFQYQGPKGQRLDKYLVSAMPDLSRSRLYTLIQDGYVTVNGRVAHKSGLPLDAGQDIQLCLPPPESADLVAEDIPIKVVFENEDVILLEKPAGMVVHPAAGHHHGTLINAALALAPEIEGVGGERRPGMVHRLDKDTSGIILMAKNDPAHRWLTDQFKLRKVSKLYLALVDGHPPTPEGRVEAPIGRDPFYRQRMAIVTLEKGRQAITSYRSLERFPNYELIEAHPITGRTHQIRLHLAFIGCPIAGDTLYGHRHSSLTIPRFFLHAFRLTITLPGEKTPRTFEAPLPPDLLGVLKDLRQ